MSLKFDDSEYVDNYLLIYGKVTDRHICMQRRSLFCVCQLSLKKRCEDHHWTWLRILKGSEHTAHGVKLSGKRLNIFVTNVEKFFLLNSN